MKNNKRGFAALSIILIIITAVIVCVGVYIYVNKNTKAMPVSVPIVIKDGISTVNPVQDLSVSSAQILVAKVKYNCDNGKAVYASFYNGEQISVKPGQLPIPAGSVVTTLVGRGNFDLPQTISASGARYANGDESLVFWIKGDGVSVLENGAEINYTGCIVDASGSTQTALDEVPHFNGGILPANEFKGNFGKTGEYSYQIGKDAKIIFVSRQDQESKWAGNVILKNGGNDYVLLEDVPISGPGDGMVVVWTTNDPNILLLRHSDGDLGWWAAQDYYLDLAEKKIVLSLNYGSDSYLTVKKDDSAAVELDLKVLDDCGKNGERAGKKAQIADLTFNGKAANVLKNSIEVDCLDTDMFGPYYSPEFDLVQRKIENDFSKFHFALVGQTWEAGAAMEIWSHEFYISLNDPSNIKIYQESL